MAHPTGFEPVTLPSRVRSIQLSYGARTYDPENDQPVNRQVTA